MLAAAARRGAVAAGSDRDATKVRGCRDNLDHVGLAATSLRVADAARDPLPEARAADCVVLNLPWGEKVAATFGEKSDQIVDKHDLPQFLIC